LPSFFLGLHVETFFFHDNLFFESAHSKFSEDNINVVVELNVKLDSINGIQVTLSFLIVSINIWNGTLSGQNLGHVVILHIAQGFFVIFVSSAGQVMQIVDQGENPSVHLHKLNQGHEGTLELLIPGLAVEDFNKGFHDNLNLNVCKSVS
jgi:hypothetical protein